MLTYPLLKIGKKTSNTSNPCDIFNMNETGLFFRTTEDKTFHQKGQECSGGKRTKMWLTISLCTNMVGDKETPLVIWKSLNPRFFKRVKKKALPVKCHGNKKDWMTSGIFETWLKKFDKRMGRKGRKVLLFLDNATSHSNVQLWNVKLKYIFLKYMWNHKFMHCRDWIFR